MNSLGRMTKSGVDVENSNGDKFTFSPLELRHIAELDEWLQYEPFRKVGKKCKMLKDSGVSQLAIDKLVEDAEKTSQAIANNPEIKEKAMGNIAAVIKMLQLSLSVRHPDISDKQIAELVDSHGITVLKDIVEKLTDVTEQEAKN